MVDVGETVKDKAGVSLSIIGLVAHHQLTIFPNLSWQCLGDCDRNQFEN